jgi:hypothetical protein
MKADIIRRAHDRAAVGVEQPRIGRNVVSNEQVAVARRLGKMEILEIV